jgi:hypothetical protein
MDAEQHGALASAFPCNQQCMTKAAAAAAAAAAYQLWLRWRRPLELKQNSTGPLPSALPCSDIARKEQHMFIVQQ